MPANVHVSFSKTPHRPNNSLYPPHSSKQEDLLYKASAPTPSNQPPGTLLSANNNPVRLDTVSAAASTSMLPPIPSCLRDHIVSSEFIDFNSLLTRTMFSTNDGPTQFQSSPPLLTLQMSAQNSGVQVSQAPTIIRKINSFALWIKAWNVYASILLLPIQHVHRNCWAINALSSQPIYNFHTSILILDVIRC